MHWIIFFINLISIKSKFFFFKFFLAWFWHNEGSVITLLPHESLGINCLFYHVFSHYKMTLFTSIVSCGGHAFQTTTYYTTIEEAESSAIWIALEHFNVIPHAYVAPSPPSVARPVPPPSVALTPHASLAPFLPFGAPFLYMLLWL